MSKKDFQTKETKNFFAIKSDLADAVRDGIPSVIDFHINELIAMQMHTDSDTLRRACAETIAGCQAEPVAAHA